MYTLIGIILGIIGVFYRAFVAVQLYNMFIFNKFSSMPPIHVLEMIGLFLFLTILYPIPTQGHSGTKLIMKVLSIQYVGPTLVLGFGYTIYQFI